jgi:hypothetical protein
MIMQSRLTVAPMMEIRGDSCGRHVSVGGHCAGSFAGVRQSGVKWVMLVTGPTAPWVFISRPRSHRI